MHELILIFVDTKFLRYFRAAVVRIQTKKLGVNVEMEHPAPIRCRWRVDSKKNHQVEAFVFRLGTILGGL